MCAGERLSLPSVGLSGSQRSQLFRVSFVSSISGRFVIEESGRDDTQSDVGRCRADAEAAEGRSRSRSRSRLTLVMEVNSFDVFFVRLLSSFAFLCDFVDRRRGQTSRFTKSTKANDKQVHEKGSKPLPTAFCLLLAYCPATAYCCPSASYAPPPYQRTAKNDRLCRRSTNRRHTKWL